MKQHEAVILAMQQNGGYATLGQLYQKAPKIPDCQWGTKTPFASIRRIVQTHEEFFKVRPGLWALTANKERVLQMFSGEIRPEREREYSHYFFQGLIVEIGNMKGYQTIVPAQDKNKPFANQSLGDVTSLQSYYDFTYSHVMNKAQTIDVTWFNERRFPNSFFEIEHSTDFNNSLLKFIEFQDFKVNFIIVADNRRQREYESKISSSAFSPIKAQVRFFNYDAVAELHTKISETIIAEKALS